MADEVNVAFDLPGDPAANIAAWRASPPPFLEDYRRVDESYESLVYESDVTTTFTKLATFGFGKTLYRLAFTFRASETGTRVSVIGQAEERTVTEMGQWAAANTAH
jgi:hypothetical protein